LVLVHLRAGFEKRLGPGQLIAQLREVLIGWASGEAGVPLGGAAGGGGELERGGVAVRAGLGFLIG